MTYPGGKNGSGVYQRIISQMPPHEVYIEPFLGGGAVMRLKRAARLSIGIDLDCGALKLAITGIAESAGTRAPAFRAMPPPESPNLARAADSTAAGDVRSRRAGSGEKRRRPSPWTALEYSAAGIARNGEATRSRARSLDPAMQAASELSRCSIAIPGAGGQQRFEFLHGDGIAFLKSYPWTGRELVYCDPPYLASVRSRPARDYYRYELKSDVDHRRLLRVLRKLPCPVMISGYHSALYAAELASWRHATFTTTTRGGRPATEWLWCNFPPAVELHDYRYLGEGFRERERIKRMQRRWSARLARMPLLERQALLSAIGEQSNKTNSSSSFSSSVPSPVVAIGAAGLSAGPAFFLPRARAERGGEKNFVTSQQSQRQR